MIYHFLGAFSVFACVSFVSTQIRLAAINIITQAPMDFDQIPNIFISSTGLCEWNEWIRCGALEVAHAIPIHLSDRNDIQRNLIPCEMRAMVEMSV